MPADHGSRTLAPECARRSMRLRGILDRRGARQGTRQLHPRNPTRVELADDRVGDPLVEFDPLGRHGLGAGGGPREGEGAAQSAWLPRRVPGRLSGLTSCHSLPRPSPCRAVAAGFVGRRPGTGRPGPGGQSRAGGTTAQGCPSPEVWAAPAARSRLMSLPILTPSGVGRSGDPRRSQGKGLHLPRERGACEALLADHGLKPMLFGKASRRYSRSALTTFRASMNSGRRDAAA